MIFYFLYNSFFFLQLFILLEKIKSRNKIITEGEYTIKRHAPNMSQYSHHLSVTLVLNSIEFNKNIKKIKTELAKWPRDQLPYYHLSRYRFIYLFFFCCLLNEILIFTLLTRWEFHIFYIYLHDKQKSHIWFYNNAIIIDDMRVTYYFFLT